MRAFAATLFACAAVAIRLRDAAGTAATAATAATDATMPDPNVTSDPFAGAEAGYVPPPTTDAPPQGPPMTTTGPAATDATMPGPNETSAPFAGAGPGYTPPPTTDAPPQGPPMTTTGPATSDPFAGAGPGYTPPPTTDAPPQGPPMTSGPGGPDPNVGMEPQQACDATTDPLCVNGTIQAPPAL